MTPEEVAALLDEIGHLRLLRLADRAEVTRCHLRRGRPTASVENLVHVATDPTMEDGAQDLARRALQRCDFPLDHLDAAGALLRSMETSR